MAHYLVKRNIPSEIKLILGILIVSLILVTLTNFKIEIGEEYNESVPEVRSMPYNKVNIVHKNITVTNTSFIFENLEYSLTKDGPITTSINSDKKYATQKYELNFNQNIDFCVEFIYSFYDDYDIVNSDGKTFCFENESSKSFELKEMYTGSKSELLYKINFTELPQKMIEVKADQVVTIPEEVTTTYYENETFYVNATKTRYTNKTLISWMFE